MVGRGSHVGADCDKRGLLGRQRMVGKKGKTRVSAHGECEMCVLSSANGGNWERMAPQRVTKHTHFLAQVPSTWPTEESLRQAQ